MKIGYTWTGSSKQKFKSALKSLRRGSPKIAWNMINRLANFTAFSAEKAAKVGQRKHETVRARNIAEARQLGFAADIGTDVTKTGNEVVAVKFFHQDKPPTWAYFFKHQTAEIEDYRQIRFRGLAKATWRSIKGKLGNTAFTPDALIARVAKGVTWVKFHRGNPMYIIFSNRLSYMANVQPTILSDAIAKAERRMVAAEAAIATKKLSRLWDDWKAAS